MVPQLSRTTTYCIGLKLLVVVIPLSVCFILQTEAAPARRRTAKRLTVFIKTNVKDTKRPLDLWELNHGM